MVIMAFILVVFATGIAAGMLGADRHRGYEPRPATVVVAVLNPFLVSFLVFNAFTPRATMSLEVGRQRSEATLARVTPIVAAAEQRGGQAADHPLFETLRAGDLGGAAGMRHLRRVASNDPDEHRRTAARLLLTLPEG